jgi:hypothetical protein
LLDEPRDRGAVRLQVSQCLGGGHEHLASPQREGDLRRAAGLGAGTDEAVEDRALGDRIDQRELGLAKAKAVPVTLERRHREQRP